MKEDKTGYAFTEKENKTGTTDSTLSISSLQKSYDGFIFEGGKAENATEVKPASFDSQTIILADGSRVINLYYKIKEKSSGGGGGGGASIPTTPKVIPGKNITDKEEKKTTEEAIGKIIIKDGKITSLPDGKDIKIEGYKFDGFFYDKDFAKPVKAGDKIVGETKIFIKWIKNEEAIDLKLTVQTTKPYIKGYDDGEFKPNRNITRAEFATVIAGMFEEFDEKNLELYIEKDKNFTDVRTDFWYTSSIGFVVDEGIMIGYDDKTFKPDAYITRAEAAKVLSLAFNIKGGDAKNDFENELEGKWYEEYVTKLVTAGLIKGYEDGTFKGDNNMTRIQLVILINRITGKTITEEELNTLTVPFKDVKRTNWFYKDVLIATK